MSNDDRDTGEAADRRKPPAKARNAERFDRQAAALRENLRRRNARRRAAMDEAPEEPQN